MLVKHIFNNLKLLTKFFGELEKHAHNLIIKYKPFVVLFTMKIKPQLKKQIQVL